MRSFVILLDRQWNSDAGYLTQHCPVYTLVQSLLNYLKRGTFLSTNSILVVAFQVSVNRLVPPWLSSSTCSGTESMGIHGTWFLEARCP